MARIIRVQFALIVEPDLPLRSVQKVNWLLFDLFVPLLKHLTYHNSVWYVQGSSAKRLGDVVESAAKVL